METLTLIFFFATMGLFILSTFKRKLSTISLMFLMAGATLALTLSDPTLSPETDNTVYMIMLILDALFILYGIYWALDPEKGRKGRCRRGGPSGTWGRIPRSDYRTSARSCP